MDPGLGSFINPTSVGFSPSRQVVSESSKTFGFSREAFPCGLRLAKILIKAMIFPAMGEIFSSILTLSHQLRNSVMDEPKKLFNKNFVLLWAGQAVSGLGSGFFTVAVLLWLKDMGSSASLMGLLMVASTLPGVFLGPFGGTVADRFSRKKIIIFSDLLNGFSILLFTAALFTRSEDRTLILTLLFIASLLRGITQSFFGPAIVAALPDLVPKERVLAANSLRMLTAQAIGIVGQSLGGLAYVAFGAIKIFALNSISYILSAISEFFLTIPQKFQARTESGFGPTLKRFFADTGEGLRYVWTRSGLTRFLLVFALINFFLNPFGVMVPFFVEDHLKTGDQWLGYLLGAFALGNVIGLILFNALQLGPRAQGLLLTLIPMSLGLIYGLMGIFLIPVVALLLMLSLGVLTGIFNLAMETIMQVRTPSEIRGRVFGLLGTLSAGLVPISLGLGGVVVDRMGKNIPLIFQACGVMIIVLALILSLSGEFRALLATDIKQTAPDADEKDAVAAEP